MIFKKKPAKVQQIGMDVWKDLSQPLAGLQTISISIGPTSELFVLATVPPFEPRFDTPGGSFPYVTFSRPQDYIILKAGESGISRFNVNRQLWNYHFVQPLPGAELLLVCARSHYRSADDFDLNAKVFSESGILRSEFLLGDGIEKVQATSTGQIWVSYFDEGVFGNFGWNKPIGAPGLIGWDRNGEQFFWFSPPQSLDFIADCYALNVLSDTETWCYYYTPFVLVHIKHGQCVDYWNCPIHGSKIFLVENEFVLFQGGYDDSERYHLFRLKTDHHMEKLASYQLVNSQGAPIISPYVTARGNLLFLLEGSFCYLLDLSSLLSRVPG